MLVTIDPTSPVPIYAQIAASIRRSLTDGHLIEGERLPGARELAEGLGINLHTVLRGYQELRDEGLIELRRGRGAVITAHGVRAAGAHGALTAYIEAARRAGLTAEEATRMVAEGMSS